MLWGRWQGDTRRLSCQNFHLREETIWNFSAGYHKYVLEIGALSFWCIQVVKCSTIIWFERSTPLLAFSRWNWCCWRNKTYLMFGNIFESFNWTLKECWEVYFDGGIQSSTLRKSKESGRGDFELFLSAKSSQNGKTCVANYECSTPVKPLLPFYSAQWTMNICLLIQYEPQCSEFGEKLDKSQDQDRSLI